MYWEILEKGKECKSADTKMGDSINAGECAQKVKEAGGAFFIFSNDVTKHKRCYIENTATANCDEGWEDDSYDFYEIKGNF